MTWQRRSKWTAWTCSAAASASKWPNLARAAAEAPGMEASLVALLARAAAATILAMDFLREAPGEVALLAAAEAGSPGLTMKVLAEGLVGGMRYAMSPSLRPRALGSAQNSTCSHARSQRGWMLPQAGRWGKAPPRAIRLGPPSPQILPQSCRSWSCVMQSSGKRQRPSGEKRQRRQGRQRAHLRPLHRHHHRRLQNPLQLPKPRTRVESSQQLDRGAGRLVAVAGVARAGATEAGLAAAQDGAGIATGHLLVLEDPAVGVAAMARCHTIARASLWVGVDAVGAVGGTGHVAMRLARRPDRCWRPLKTMSPKQRWLIPTICLLRTSEWSCKGRQRTRKGLCLPSWSAIIPQCSFSSCICDTLCLFVKLCGYLTDFVRLFSDFWELDRFFLY